MRRPTTPSGRHGVRRPGRLAAGALVAGLVLAAAACGGDDDSGSTTTAPPGTEAPASTAAPDTTAPAGTEAPAGDVVELVASDFAFGGLPETVAPGTRFNLTNTSATELHEFVLVRLADDDTRSAEEIVHGDLEAALTSGPPALVVLAPPGGGEQIVAVGDGALHEPGRYLAVCMIPTGVDAQTYLDAAAASNGAPPDVPGGPPHVVHGMFGEVTVA